MNTYGYELPDDKRAAAVERMKAGPFTAMQLEHALITIGVPEFGTRNGYEFKAYAVAHRTADKLIQKHRKAGDIKRIGRHWYWND
jgi:hypothetical protein